MSYIPAFCKRPGISLCLAMLLYLLLAAGCKPSPDLDQEKGRRIARVFDKVLYEKDVEEIVPAGTMGDDSTALVKSYVENWIRQNLVLRRAELNLDPDQHEVDRLIENYRNDLLQYLYKREFVRQKLDTVVSDEAIAAYYNENKDKFELQEDVVQVSYARFEKAAPGLDKVRKWISSGKRDDQEAYKDHCFKFASSYYMNDSLWMDARNLMKAVPVTLAMLEQQKAFEVEDSTFVYFVHIVAFRKKESLSPLGYERERIKEIMINKQKVKLLERLEQNLFEEALKKNDFEIYE